MSDMEKKESQGGVKGWLYEKVKPDAQVQAQELDISSAETRAILLGRLLGKPTPLAQRTKMLQTILSAGMNTEQKELLVQAFEDDKESKNMLSIEQKHRLLTLFLGASDWSAVALEELNKSEDADRYTQNLAWSLLHIANLSKDEREQLLPLTLAENLSQGQFALIMEKLAQANLSAEQMTKLAGILMKADNVDKAVREQLLNWMLEMPVSKSMAQKCMETGTEYTVANQNEDGLAFAKLAIEFESAYNKLKPWADNKSHPMAAKREDALHRVLFEGASVEDALLDIICEGNLCYLKGGCMEFIDRKQLWLMMEELLFGEEYYCKFDSDAPTILDCGVNIGLAIYFAKVRNPKAKLVGFEPWSVAYECAMRNVERNGWQDVTLHHAALGGCETTMELITTEANSLAGTLTNRMDDYIEDNHLQENRETVSVVPLSRYLDGPVDFLKMDIEGMEEQVLTESKDKLGLIKWLFVEYHYGPNLSGNSMRNIIDMLDEAGFVYETALSEAYSKVVQTRPQLHVGKKVSELIRARRKDTIENK